MAAVTLADLINPLIKLEKSFEAQAKKLDELVQAVAIGRGAAGIKSLDKEILSELKTQTKLLEQIATKSGDPLTAVKAGVAKAKAEVEKLTEGGKALSALGVGAKDLGIGLMILTLVPDKVLAKFTRFILGIASAFEDVDVENLKTGGEALNSIGDGILNFTKGVALSSLLILPFIPILPILMLAVYGVSWVVSKVGQMKGVDEGANVISKIGDAVFGFSKSLALSALLIIPGIIALPFLALAVAVMAGLMSVVGARSKTIERGAKTLDKIGDGIRSFAIGLAFFAVTTFFILMQPMILVGMVASLVLIGGAVALLGVVHSTIKKGSVALMIMGVGLGIFSVGYGIFALVSSFIEFSDIGKQVLIIGGIGLVTALLGVGLSFIAQGALSLLLIGIALIPFGIGYAIFAMSTKGIGIGDVGVQLAVLGGIGVVMGLVGVAVALTAGAALLGPALFAAAGLSLVVLAGGLLAMKSVNFTKEDSENLGFTLGAVAMAFSGADPEAGFFKNVGNVFGRVVQSGGMAAAAVGFTAAGVSLVALSFGLKAFKRIGWDAKTTKVGSTEVGTDSYSLSIALGSITAAFAQAGGEPSNPGGLFGAVFGTAFSPNTIERGIDSVMGAGKALTDITTGLVSFQKLIDSQVDFTVLESSITKTVGFIQTAFSAVAGEGNVAGGGFFGSLFGIKRNKVEEGIRSVKGAGKALTDITTGLVSFQKLIDSQVDFAVLESSITKTVGFVQSAFAAVGGAGNTEGGGFFGSLFGIKRNKVEEGIRAVQGAGKELTGIASGLVSFNNLAKTSIPFGDPSNPIEGTLAYAVIQSLGFVRGAFAAVGGAEVEDSALFGLIKWDENLVAKGINAVKGAGATLTNIATGLLNFSKIKNPADLSSKISLFLSSISTALSALATTSAAQSPSGVKILQDFFSALSNAQKIADPLAKVASSADKIKTSINAIKLDNLKSTVELMQNINDLKETDAADGLKSIAESIQAVIESLKPKEAAATTAAAPASLPPGVQGTQKASPAAKPATGSPQDMSQTLAKLQATLSQINVTLSNLPADIAAIEIKMPKD
jgi:hypothetical protein